MEHRFSNETCEICSIKKYDAIIRSFQFCSDEVKSYELVCNRENRSFIERLYASDEQISPEIFRKLGYRSSN